MTTPHSGLTASPTVPGPGEQPAADPPHREPEAAPAAPRRDAEASKAAILRAARYLLARHAHADITLKAVADRAG